jgi:P27 family predicted phage terminase small subunit
MPPRKPTALKVLAGTWRRDRANPREPKAPVAAPRPSRRLAAAERREYGKLVRRVSALRVATGVDDLALELAAAAAAEFWRLHAVIAEKGAVYTTTTPTGSEMVRQRPEVALMQDAWRRFASMLRQFGLDPVSRTRVEEIEPVSHSKWTGASERNPGRFFGDA